MHAIKYGFVAGAFVYRWPFFPIRSVIRQNLDWINYLKISILNLKRFSWRVGFIKETHLWVFDDWSDTYFHWTFDVLVKLRQLKESSSCNQIAVPVFLQQNTYAIESLRFLGYSITLLEKTYLFKQFVSCANTTYFSQQALQRIRATIFSKLNLPIQAERIYISRKNATRRRLQNEHKFTDELQKLGIKVYNLEELPWQAQVDLFQRAEVVVGMHGAGLSNIMYCSQLKLLVELIPSQATNKLFEQLAATLGFPYAAIILNDQLDPHTETIEIKDDSINEVLERLKSIGSGN